MLAPHMVSGRRRLGSGRRSTVTCRRRVRSLFVSGEQAVARYVERLRVPWWWWVATATLAGLFGAELWRGVNTVPAWLPFALALGLAAAGLWWLGRIEIRVTDDELVVDDARLPLTAIADVVPIDAAGRRELLGPAADPM